MMPKVVRVEPKDGYVLWVEFSDGARGVWDFFEIFEPEGPMVAPLRNPAYFRRVGISRGALTWPNGFDAAPDALYADMAAAARLTWPSRAA